MGHISNIADSVVAGIVLIALTGFVGYTIKITKSSGVTRTLIRFSWSCVLLATCIFCVYASFTAQHGRGFNNGVAFITYLISSLLQALRFVLFNSSWIGIFANTTKDVLKHIRDLASPDYKPKVAPLEANQPPLAQMIARIEETDFRSPEMYAIVKQLVGIGAEAVEPLVVNLSHNRYDARQNAAYALGQIKDERAVKHLIEALGNEGVTLYISMALAEFGRPVVEPLAVAARSANTRIREGAIVALGMCEDTRSVEELKKLFEEWLSGRRLECQKLSETSQKLLDEYWLFVDKDMPLQERAKLLTKRKDDISALRRQSVDYDDLQRWWMGRTIVDSLSGVATSAVKQLSSKSSAARF